VRNISKYMKICDYYIYWNVFLVITAFCYLTGRNWKSPRCTITLSI